MRSILEIKKDYFQNAAQNNNGYNQIAFLSLKAGMIAYYSSYENMKLYYSSVVLDNPTVEDIHQRYTPEYINTYSDVVIKFHHFFELIIKDILKSCGGKIDHKGFKRHFGRLVNIINNESKNEYLFLSKNREVLEEFNSLRNKIVHSGSDILHYKALDELIGGYIFPLILDITKLPKYKRFNRYWKHKPLSYKIDPFLSIIDCVKENYNSGKVAFIKELGRAAYHNPLAHSLKFIREIQVPNYINRALLEMDGRIGVFDNYTCPVCGIKTLLVYEDTEVFEKDDGTSSNVVYSHKIICVCCSFSLYRGLDNP